MVNNVVIDNVIMHHQHCCLTLFSTTKGGKVLSLAHHSLFQASCMACILSIETATNISSVALHQKGKLLAATECHIPRSHHAVLAKIVRNVLSLSHVHMKDLTAIAVSHGPGSYTGLRIGLSVAKGLAYGCDIPLIVINTLAIIVSSALAHAPQPGRICALMDAGRKRVYRMVADVDGKIIAETAVCELTANSLKRWLSSLPLYIVGSGAEQYITTYQGMPGIQLIKKIYPKAADMGKIAYQKFLQQAWADKAYVEPLYQ